MNDPLCRSCWMPRSNHPYRHPFVGASYEETIKELEAKLENAAQAMSETQPSWERRCFAIMAALELDFGEPTPEIPEQSGWYAMKMKQLEESEFKANQKVRELQVQLARRRDVTLDAANTYIKMQYGIGALGNPIDRSRISQNIADTERSLTENN